MNFNDFKAGNKDFRPLALWSLNHELTKEELSWQIAEMAAKGLQGFIMHARSGLLTPYLSERWFLMLEHAILEAKRYGLKAWLYDEDPYPSGIAGGKVIADHPEYKAQMLGVKKTQMHGPGRVSLDIPLQKIIMAKAVRVEDGSIAETRDLLGQIGILRTLWQDKKAYHSYYPTTDSKAMPQYRSDTEEPYYHLDWYAPEGEWHILVFYSSPCGKFWLFDSFTDLLNPEAVAYFMQTTYIPYEQRFGQYFGNVIPGIFIDEPKFVSDPYPWTGKLPEEFAARKGYEIGDALIALELDISGSPQKRKDFWEVVGNLFNDAYTRQISQWCQRNGLMLIGHNSPEEEPGDQVVITGDLMHFMKHMDIPGTDLITYMIGDRKHPIVNLGPKLASSVSRQWKEGKALCEAFGVMEWKLDLADMAWIANWLFSLGVNVISPHTFIYSIDGCRKKDAAPSEFYQAPYWAYFKTYSDYLASLGYLLGDAEPCVHTALVYPFDSFMSLQTLHHKDCNELRDRFVYLFDTLLRSHVQFELVDIDDLTGATVENGCLNVGKRSYRQVIIPPVVYISTGLEAVMEKLREQGVFTAAHVNGEPAYVESKGSLMPQDKIPFMQMVSMAYSITGNPQDGYTCDNLAEILSSCADEMTIFGEDSKDVFLNHSMKDGGHVFFLFNSLEKAADLRFSLRFRCKMKVEKWNTRGQAAILVLADADGSWSVSIPPRSAVFIIATEDDSPIERLTEEECGSSAVSPNEVLLASQWEAKPDKRNVLILNRWALEEGGVHDPAVIDFRRGAPVVEPCRAVELNLKGYPTVLWYKAVFNLRGTPGRMGLVLEKSAIQGDFEVFCNGIPCTCNVPVREYDCNNIEYPLSAEQLETCKNHFYKQDEVVIAIRVAANCPQDGLLEPVRLFGDFLVELNSGESLGATLAAATGLQVLQTGSWAHQGYPHYSGTITYEQSVWIPPQAADKRSFLRFGVGSSGAEVFVNGVSAGAVAWEPYELDISSLLNAGSNRIGIQVANTLENLLYGTGKPSGILGQVRIINK
jgi:hypothetical protein